MTFQVCRELPSIPHHITNYIVAHAVRLSTDMNVSDLTNPNQYQLSYENKVMIISVAFMLSVRVADIALIFLV